MNKCQQWYNDIAIRNNGYRSGASFIKEGVSGEDEFEKRLIEILPNFTNVLDVGCGHGEFTLQMSKYSKKITGGDSAIELINIANELKAEMGITNADFIYFHTHEMDKVKDVKYDLIYNRRGPTSIYDNKQILADDGIVIGIHPLYALERVEQRLVKGGFEVLEIDVFEDCMLIFDTESDFAEHISSMHMSKDYTLKENKAELDKLVIEHTINGKLSLAEERFIVKAR